MLGLWRNMCLQHESACQFMTGRVDTYQLWMLQHVRAYFTVKFITYEQTLLFKEQFSKKV